MIEYIQWVITHPILAFIVLLVEYIVIMKLSYQKRWAGIAKIATVPFVIQDAIFNIFILSWFLEFPKEWLVTTRLKRWKLYQMRSRRNIVKRARYNFAWWLCDILNKYDKEKHC